MVPDIRNAKAYNIVYILRTMSVSVTMATPGPMFNFHMKLAKLLNPSMNLAIRFLEFLEPRERSMISSQGEFSSKQIMFVVLREIYNRKHFTSRYAIIALGLVQTTATINVYAFFPILNL